MKALTAFLRKAPVLGFYAAALAAALLWSVGLALYDAVTLPPAKALTPEDFELVDLAPLGDGRYTALSGDPQMLLPGTVDGAPVRTVAYALTQGGQETVCAYYTRQEGQDFSDRMRLWPDFGQMQQALYVLPRGGVATVRLDVTSVAGDVLDFAYITLNAHVPLWRYFTPGPMAVALFLTLPGLVYLFCVFLRRCLRGAD